MTNTKQNISIAEAARLLGITPQTLHQWRKRGYILAAELPNGRYLIPGSELERLATPNTRKGVEGS